MDGEPLTMQERLRRRRSGAFVGRQAEMAAFVGNLGTGPDDPAHQFLFHVHGPGGIGKTTLIGQWQAAARAHGALVAAVGENATTVIAAMAETAARLAEQGRPLKAFDRLLGVYRQRRQEADALVAADPQPSLAGTVAAQAGLAGLGLLPGVGALAGALDPAQVAQGVDRLRALLSARFRDEQDVRLVLDPVAVLSPVFTTDLASAAAHAPWLTLFFDTYERTGPVLDVWLRDLFVLGRYGGLPGNVVVTLAGQGGLAPAVWADHLDLVTRLALAPFTEAEARQLLAARGVTDEAVVAAVLRLTGGLPVLVSTLAATRPGGPDAVGDPADTAVERFLRWEADPAARAAALAAALPLHLDEDVYRVAVADDAPEAADRYDWLRGLPFVTGHAGHARYHEVVRAQMLRLLRTRAPQRWREQHERLAAAYGGWRERTEQGRDVGELWADGTWRGHRLHETYHQLCADPRAALPDALLHLARACTAGPGTARRWVRMLTDAAQDADAPQAAALAAELSEVYTRTPDPQAGPAGALGPGAGDGGAGVPPQAGPAARAITVVLERGGLDRDRRAVAHAVRAWAHRQAGDPFAALADYDRAERLGLRTFLLHAGRADTRWTAGDPPGAVADYAAALSAEPDHPRAGHVRTQLGGALMVLDRPSDALVELDAVIEADPADLRAREYRAMALLALRRPVEALADVEACLALSAAPDMGHRILRAVAALEAGHHARASADLDALLADPGAVQRWAGTLGGLADPPAGDQPAPREA